MLFYSIKFVWSLCKICQISISIGINTYISKFDYKIEYDKIGIVVNIC